MLAILVGAYSSGNSINCSTMRFDVDDPNNLLARISDCARSYLGIGEDEERNYDFGKLMELVENDQDFAVQLADDGIRFDPGDYAVEIVDYHEEWA